jgi:hypothetical protein
MGWNNFLKSTSGKPLNGEKTHPLSAHAIATLTRIAQNPVPRQEVNAGVVNRLEREELVVRRSGQSPYKTGTGTVDFLEITEFGRCALLGK